MAENSVRTVRTEPVEVQCHVTSNEGERITRCGATGKQASFVRKYAALPFDRLRANGAVYRIVIDPTVQPREWLVR